MMERPIPWQSARQLARQSARQFAWLALALLAGCSLAPSFTPPALDVPARYKELNPQASQAPGNELGLTERGSWQIATPAENQPRGEWWKAFADPLLDQLEADALAANQSLKAAAARVVQARALVGVAEAARIPQVDAAFGPTRAKPTGISLGLPQGLDVKPYNVWRANLGLAYEVDLFGRVANDVAAAEGDYAASEALYRSVTLALQADVAETYFLLRQAAAELQVWRDTARLREENLHLVQRRFDLGDVGELDLARAQTDLATTQAQAIAAERRASQLEHALAILLGKAPAAFALAAGPLPATLPVIPAGLPSSLLERRPDIAAAIHTMAAANARIGVAKAAWFPALNITGALGYESSELNDLFRWSSRTWVIGPLVGAILTLPIIDGGRTQARVERSYAALEESVANYRQQVLVAFGEVEDQLVALRTLAGQAEATHAALLSASRAFRLAELRYRAGATGYIDVIEAQRSLLVVQLQETQLRGSRATATVALIRALGGGWE